MARSAGSASSNDVAEIMRQLGILPKAGNLGERAVIALANLQTHLRRR
jgi:hypothetical protein